MRIITQSQVEAHLPMPACIDAMRTVMMAVSAGRTHLPIRQFMPVADLADCLGSKINYTFYIIDYKAR